MARILVVEDEEDIYDFIKVTLEPHKHLIHHCSDGIKALQVLKTQPFDLYLLDIMIPGMDGYSILLEMEEIKEKQSIPCIVMTALKPAEKLFDRFKNVKFFIAKPFPPDELIQKVNTALTPEGSSS